MLATSSETRRFVARARVLFEGNDYRLRRLALRPSTPGRTTGLIRTDELDLDFSRNVGVARHG